MKNLLRKIVFILAAMSLLFCNLIGAQSKAVSDNHFAFPSDDEIRQILADRIDIQHKSVGMVVGIITPEGRRIISYGQMNQNDKRPLNGDSVFEVGSVTKIFTALLLTDMVKRGEVSLTDPVEKYLPPGVTVPVWNNHKITLIDLATQTSGLPFFPTDIPVDSLDAAIKAVAAYKTQDIYKFLSSYKLTRDVGSQWEYSNLGFALLGLALSNRAGTDYDTLVRDRIIRPLGLKSTTISMSLQMNERLAIGHDAKLQTAPAINEPAFEAAGSLRSTANDLLSFLSAFLGDTKSPLESAMAAMQETRRPGPGFKQAIGWWIVPLTPDDEGFVFHGGQTPGYSAAVAFDPKKHAGIVVLSNCTEDDGGLSWHLLRPNFPVATSAANKASAEKARKEITVDQKVLDAYAGQYKTSDGTIVIIEREGQSLVMKSSTTPQGGLRLHAETDRKFFVTETDLQVDFQIDAQGQVSGLTIHFAGGDYPATRIK